MTRQSAALDRLHRLREAGQSAGHETGQTAEMLSRSPDFCPAPTGQLEAQKSANYSNCPAVLPSRDRDSRTVGPSNGTVSETGSGTRDAAGVATTLKYWRVGLLKLDQDIPAVGFDGKRWAQLVRDCERLFGDHSKEAARLGWTTESLFGVDPAGAGVPFRGGLASRLEGRPVEIIDGRFAEYTLLTGKRLWFPNGWGAGLSPIWELPR